MTDFAFDVINDHPADTRIRVSLDGQDLGLICHRYVQSSKVQVWYVSDARSWFPTRQEAAEHLRYRRCGALPLLTVPQGAPQ